MRLRWGAFRSTTPITLCLIAVALVASAIPSHASTETRAKPRRLVRNVSTFVDRSHTVAPAALPVPSSGDGIGPGSLLFITIPNEGKFQCTAAFVFSDATSQYLGSAGHCFLPEGKKGTHGSDADYDASGVVVEACVSGCSFGGFTGQIIQGTFVTLGSVAYARSGGIGEDFGVVRIPPELTPQVRAAVPVWGGPSAVSDDVSGFVCYFGRGIVVGEVFATMGRVGYGLGADTDGSFTAAGPLGSGDSGAALETCTPGGDAQAAGIITHGAGATDPAVTGILLGTTVSKALAMAARDAVLTLSVVLAS
jgi:hypothetical protein